MDRDGYISNGELYLVLKQMVGNNLKVSVEGARHMTSADSQDQQLQQIVDKTIMEADKDGCVKGAGRRRECPLTPATASSPSRSLPTWCRVRTLSSESSGNQVTRPADARQMTLEDLF
jgi:hypothetical protein